MSLVFRTSCVQSQINSWCKMALGNKLYIHGFMNESFYSLPNYYINSMAVCFNKDFKMIGTCLLLNYHIDISIFVDPKYRRKGIGKELLRRLIRRSKRPELRCDFHNDAALCFFQSSKSKRIIEGAP